MSFNHLMIDIETLGQNSRAVICSIAAIPFNIETGETGEVFYEKINIESCVRAGLKIESETLLWWSKQNSLAYMEMLSGKTDIGQALLGLSVFIRKYAKDAEVWGNGSRFDLGILRDAYNAFNCTVPWDYGNERDVRTLLSLYPPAKDGVPKPVNRHFPVDDCQYQIAYCTKAYNAIKI